MPDFRVSDTAAEHPKIRAAGLAAFGLWTAAGSWCMSPAHLTDGWVPLHYVKTWPSGKKLAEKLVQVGLWREQQRDGISGYLFHDWDGFQRSAESIEGEKRKARDRMARIRSGGVRANVRANTERTEPARSANVHDSLTLTHKEHQDLGGQPPVGNARARGRGATGPHSAAAYRLVDRVLGRRLTSGTRTALAIEVAALLAEATEPELVAALERWNTRTGIGPRLLGGLVDDLRKEARGATARPATAAPGVSATDAHFAHRLARYADDPDGRPPLLALPGGAS